MTLLDAHKLTVYFGERDRAGDEPLSRALLHSIGEAGLPVAALLRGTEGFGAGHGAHTQRLLSLSEDPPLIAVGVGSAEQAAVCAARARELCGGRGLVTVERARLRSVPSAGGVSLDGEHDECKLTIYWGRGERVGTTPAYRAIVRALRDSGVVGATVLLGVDGRIGGRRARARMLGSNAGVPLLVVSVGPRETLQRAWEAVRVALDADPPATVERVGVLKRDGRSVGVVAGFEAAAGRGDRLKLTVFSGEQAHHGGRPQYLELMRRLRLARAGGATCLRGVWGYHGDHEPRGDTIWSLRRRVPVVTIVVDEARRAASLYERVIDPLTDEAGLVTCETVPYDLAR